MYTTWINTNLQERNPDGASCTSRPNGCCDSSPATESATAPAYCSPLTAHWLTDVSIRLGVSIKLSCQSSNISSVQSSLR